MDSVFEQMNTFFDPKAVAIIGASRKATNVRHTLGFATNLSVYLTGSFPSEMFEE